MPAPNCHEKVKMESLGQFLLVSNPPPGYKGGLLYRLFLTPVITVHWLLPLTKEMETLDSVSASSGYDGLLQRLKTNDFLWTQRLHPSLYLLGPDTCGGSWASLDHSCESGNRTLVAKVPSSLYLQVSLPRHNGLSALQLSVKVRKIHQVDSPRPGLLSVLWAAPGSLLRPGSLSSCWMSSAFLQDWKGRYLPL